jgi:hypothetical protein
VSEALNLNSITSGTRPLTAFNARTMPVRQVVESFVENDAFTRLLRPVNTLLSGPRGSGKTTLMKMLQPMALELWTASSAISVSEQIPYTGVFIATDRTWKRQLEPHGSGGSPYEPKLRLIANAAFSMHVLREIIVAMQHRLSSPSPGLVRRSRAVLSPEGTYRLTANLARVARLDSFEPSLDGLVDALTIRLANLRAVQNALKTGTSTVVPKWSNIDALSAAEASIDIFNRAVKQDDHQWALLFDEMELAPTELVMSLLDAMRGQPRNILLKLSLSPVQPELSMLHLPHAGVHGQDFELIQLNYARQGDSLHFGGEMLRSAIQRRGLPNIDRTQLLGRSLFSSSDEGAGGQDREEMTSRRNNPYRKGSPLWKRYHSLAQIDPSFASWLARNGVDLNGLDGLDPIARAAKLRKVRNLVVVRQHYRSLRAGRRSRKSYELYVGADTILALCDGNARLLTALIVQLLGQTYSSYVPALPLSTTRQSQAIESIIKRFFALVYAAEAVNLPSGGKVTLADLIHRIGESLASGVVEDPFSDNAPLTFFVDRRTSPQVIRLLQLGLNVGAFVHIPKRPDYRVPLDLQGEQFRLTYVLAPYFGLPVRLGPSVALSSLLAYSRRSGSKGLRASPVLPGVSNTDGQQLALFLESE